MLLARVHEGGPRQRLLRHALPLLLGGSGPRGGGGGVHAENSIFYYVALKRRGAPPSELHIYPKGGHGYGRTKCTEITIDLVPPGVPDLSLLLKSSLSPPLRP